MNIHKIITGLIALTPFWEMKDDRKVYIRDVEAMNQSLTVHSLDFGEIPQPKNEVHWPCPLSQSLSHIR